MDGKKKREARQRWVSARKTLKLDKIKVVFTDSLLDASRQRSRSMDVQLLQEFDNFLDVSPSTHCALSDSQYLTTGGSTARLARQETNEWSRAFQTIMKSAIGRKTMLAFLETEYSDENMLFWQAVEEIKRIKDRALFESALMEVYNTFVAIDSELAINIDHSTRADIKRKVKEADIKDAPFDVLNKAQNQIYHLMEKDCFGRFIATEEYQKIAKSLGIPLTFGFGGAGGRPD